MSEGPSSVCWPGVPRSGVDARALRSHLSSRRLRSYRGLYPESLRLAVCVAHCASTPRVRIGPAQAMNWTGLFRAPRATIRPGEFGRRRAPGRPAASTRSLGRPDASASSSTIELERFFGPAGEQLPRDRDAITCPNFDRCRRGGNYGISDKPYTDGCRERVLISGLRRPRSPLQLVPLPTPRATAEAEPAVLTSLALP